MATRETTASPFTAWLEGCRPEVEAALRHACTESSLARAPERLQEAVRAALLSPGKRLRPALAMLACAAEGAPREAALPGALACEMIHAYSLVHDDLPCLDDDELRRGRPTVHVAFGEAAAVLAGDALQTLAFETLAVQTDAGLARDQALLLARASGPSGMVGGQLLDLDAEGRTARLAEVEAIHERKTAALLAVALQVGARAAGADPAPWRAYAAAVGRIFQATDDLLDATRSTAELGKTAGKDAKAGKATLVAAAGLAGAREHAGRLARQAATALEDLPARSQREELADLPAFLIERIR